MTMVYSHMVDDPFYIVQVWESPLGYSASYVIPTGETISESNGFKTKSDAIRWGWGQVAFHRQGFTNVKEIADLIEFHSDNVSTIGVTIHEFAASIACIQNSFGPKMDDMQKISDSLREVLRKLIEKKK